MEEMFTVCWKWYDIAWLHISSSSAVQDLATVWSVARYWNTHLLFSPSFHFFWFISSYENYQNIWIDDYYMCANKYAKSKRQNKIPYTYYDIHWETAHTPARKRHPEHHNLHATLRYWICFVEIIYYFLQL